MQTPGARSNMGSSPLEFSVLKTRADIETAEHEIVRRGLLPSSPGRTPRAFARVKRALGHPDPAVDLFPDPLKSWDVLRTIEAVSSSVGRDEPVLDVGSVASAVLPCLHALGYRRLIGIDLDERVLSMPHSDEIEYSVEDATNTMRQEASFAAITAISVIEHGVNDEALFAEVARLLRHGGIFVFSTDYWPEKVDTDGVSLFGLPWRILSVEEVDALVKRAARYGLVPVGDPRSRIRDVGERAVRFQDRSYTFLHGGLVRD